MKGVTGRSYLSHNKGRKEILSEQHQADARLPLLLSLGKHLGGRMAGVGETTNAR